MEILDRKPAERQERKALLPEGPSPACAWVERAVLGQILADPSRAAQRLDEVSAVLCASDFFLRSHRLIFGRLQTMRSGNLPIELVTLVEALDESEELEPAGGAAYVASLLDGVPRIGDLRAPCVALRRKARLRRAVHQAERIAQAASQPDADIPDIARQLRDLASTLLEPEK